VILQGVEAETKENEVAAGDIVPVSGTRFEETLASASLEDGSVPGLHHYLGGDIDKIGSIHRGGASKPQSTGE
jgi:hypothetical protein